MKSLKLIFVGFIIGILIGLWFGVNLGKEKPLLSNPFEERAVTEKIKTSIGKGVEKAGESIEKLGEDIKGDMNK